MIRATAVGMLLIIGGVGIAWRTTKGVVVPPQEDKRPHVEVAKATRKTIYRKVNLLGEVVPNQQVSVYARAQGYLERVNVDRGAWVKAGEELFKVSVPELDKQLVKEQRELDACAPAIERDRSSVTWRTVAHRRLVEARDRAPDLVTLEALDDAKARLDMAQAELALTQAREGALRAGVERTRALVDLESYGAPFEGVVTERWVDPGELVQPGSPKILHLMQIDPIRVRIHVPAPDVPFVRGDSEGVISFDELPGGNVRAKVGRSFWALRTSTKTMAVEFDVSNKERAIRPGMFARVRIDLDSRANALVLPAAALVSEKKKTFLYVVRDGVAKKVAIKLGWDDGVEFEVREGVGDQDEIIVTGKNLVSDGEKVRVTPR